MFGFGGGGGLGVDREASQCFSDAGLKRSAHRMMNCSLRGGRRVTPPPPVVLLRDLRMEPSERTVIQKRIKAPKHKNPVVTYERFLALNLPA